MPGIRVNDNGTWKTAQPRVNDNGTWKTPQSVWANDNGTWKKVWPAAPVFPPEAYDTVYISTSGGQGNKSFGKGFQMSGGTLPFTYTWTAVFYGGPFQDRSGSGSSSNGYISISASTYFSGISEMDYQIVGTFTVEITDAAGAVESLQVDIIAGQ